MKNMRYHLAHSRDIKKNGWNNRCPSCGQRKFSPYIDFHTGKPIDEKHCGRCCRERSCAYHMTPSEWFKEHPQEKREWLPREQYVELMRQRKKEAREACLLDPLRSDASLSPLPIGSSVAQSTDKACKQDAFVNLKVQSAQPTLSYRVGPSLGTACHLGNPLKASLRPLKEGQFSFVCPSVMKLSESTVPTLRGTSEVEQGETERGGSEKIITYLSHMSTLCTQTRSDKNNLARWLCTQFPEEQVAEVLARYRTGSTRDGRIIYWQIDYRGQVRAGKVMAYAPDGHRRKEGNGNVCWVHSIKIDGIRFDEMLAPQCLFGEHLINENDDDNDNENRYPFRNNVIAFNGDLKVLNEVKNLAVGLGEGSFAMLRMTATGEASLCLVESEKTALIMSLVCPDRVWLATGGKANFKEQMLWSLLGHEVAVYPDADALTDWEQRIHRLNRELGHCLYIPTGYYNLMNHDRPRTEGWDLADVVLRLP